MPPTIKKDLRKIKRLDNNLCGNKKLMITEYLKKILICNFMAFKIKF